MRLIPSPVLASIVVAVLAIPIGTQAQQRTVSLDDLGNTTFIEGFSLSPDGRFAVLTTARPDFEENGDVVALLLLDLDSGESTELTPDRDRVGSAAWSPDGAWVGFMAVGEAGASPQVFALPTTLGEARQVTHASAGVGRFLWAADGSGVFYSSRDPAPAGEGEERHNRSFEVGNHSYLTRATPRPMHLWYQALDGGEPERLTEGSESLNGVRVSPDGRTVAVGITSSPESGVGGSAVIRLIDLETGVARQLDLPAPTFLRAFSPDGQFLSVARPRGAEAGYSPYGILLVPVDGGAPLDVTAEIDRDLSGVEWLPDGRSLLVTGIDSTKSVIWQVFVDGSPARRIAFDGLEVGAKEATPDGRLIFLGDGSGRPPELYEVEIGEWTPRPLTHLNPAFDEIALPRVETVTWEGPDGFRLTGVLRYPPGYREGERYPLVLRIHGGPMLASTEGWDLPAQVMAAQGWLVFSPNYRGSNTQGLAFQSAVLGDAGDGPARDVMSGVDFLKSLGMLDEDRIAVSGWSYGGFMTAWLTAHYEGWAAAVAGAPVTDWFDAYNTADLTDYFRAGMGGSPWVDDRAEAYRRQSPITYANQIRTPTLILATTGDERVPITQSYKLYHALKDNGVPVRFIAYPVSGHSPSDPVHMRDVHRRWIAWITEHFDAVESPPL